MGYVIKTGKVNNIIVLDFDDMDLYKEACILKPNYTVKTRRGMHIYCLYDEHITGSKTSKIDVQTNNKLVIGENTMLKRYNCRSLLYSYLGGRIMSMSKVLMDWYCNVNESKRLQKDNETTINCTYEVSDIECKNI